MDKLTILGIPLHSAAGRDELLEKLLQLLRGEKSSVIFTPNPEILLHAHAYDAYADVLRSADLLVPDGVGIQLVGRLRFNRRVFRLPGIDLGRMLLEIAYKNRARVMFLGGRNGSAISAAERLTKSRSNLQIYATGDNVEVAETGEVPDPKEEGRIRDAILQTKPAIVFVGLGAPKQEQWIIKHKDAFPSVKIFIGIGGAFDIWSGRLKRAPKMLQMIGLEWLWRLMLEPSRISRIFRAVFLFPYYALTKRS